MGLDWFLLSSWKQWDQRGQCSLFSKVTGTLRQVVELRALPLNPLCFSSHLLPRCLWSHFMFPFSEILTYFVLTIHLVISVLPNSNINMFPINTCMGYKVTYQDNTEGTNQSTLQVYHNLVIGITFLEENFLTQSIIKENFLISALYNRDMRHICKFNNF